MNIPTCKHPSCSEDAHPASELGYCVACELAINEQALAEDWDEPHILMAEIGFWYLLVQQKYSVGQKEWDRYMMELWYDKEHKL